MQYTCKQCHKIFFVRKHGSYTPKFCSHKCYDTFRKGVSFTNKGSFQKGHLAPKEGFKKGHQPWNKNTKGIMPTREKNHKWINGKTTCKAGYLFIYKPEHPKAHSNRIPEQILIAEKALGRYLTKNEVIHHINGIKSDNRVENLYLFPSNIEHSSYHVNFRYAKCSKIIISNLTQS